LESLRNLSLKFRSSNPALPLEELLSQFPLEQIQKLTAAYMEDSFFILSSRLTYLKYFDLSRCYTSTMTFPGELFPSLIELNVSDFSSIQLTGMISLRKLEIHNTPSNQILGKEYFHSQLKSFSYSCYGDPVYDESFLWVLKNATRLSLRTAPQRDFFETAVSGKLASLDLYLLGNEVTIPERFFEVLRLHNCHPSQSSSFSKVQILILDSCSSIRDISPCKDIPYIELRHLTGVKDFSCLGNQRYLMIFDCQGLFSEAVKGFGNIFNLHIHSCHNINEITNLNGNNQYLTLNSCGELRSVELSQRDFLSVKILKCNHLHAFRILGTVYSLEFTFNKRWTKEMIPRKYQYLNGIGKEE
jgi:hypothetical protein